MKSNSASYSLLGILSIRDMSGYDIRKFVEGNIGHFWKESYGQIYPMLKRMAKQGLVKSRTERTSGKPDRQVYSLAAKGHAELVKWLVRPAMPASPKNELLLKLFFARHGKIEDAIRHVQEFKQRNEAMLQRYAQTEKWLRSEHKHHPDLPYWLITLDCGNRHARSSKEWADATLRVLLDLPTSRHTKSTKTKKRERSAKL